MRLHETIAPANHRRTAPRSWVRTDAASLDLSGLWRFRLSASADIADDVREEGLDDGDWDTLPVPSHWVLHGNGRYGRPIYTNLKYPFPLDPPYVPDENPTGDYRRQFVLPHDWSGLQPGARTILRLDGIESMARVWLNGEEVGVTMGSRLVQEFDVTDLVRDGQNNVAIRVHQWSSGSYLEDQDQWWLPGIFREVTLLARPAGCLDDVWIQADFDHETGAGRLSPRIVAGQTAFPIRLRVPDLSIDVEWRNEQEITRIDIPEVEPWSADAPQLYGIDVSSTGETVQLRVGFRTVTVDGGQVLVNGRRLHLRGVNRHEIDQREGRVFDRDRARHDLLLMKRHHVDAIRTAHYPPHPELLELTDELGFWVMDECDLETHGFEFSSWDRNPSDDPHWREAFLDRVERFVERDKNHPSVVFWSLGNESGTGENLGLMSQWIRRRDQSRPIHYEGDHEGAYTDIYSRMYPSLEEIDAFFDPAMPIGPAHHSAGRVSPAQAARVRTMPYILCEYLHAMGTGAGGAADYARRIERHPHHLGGFVWEWRDHALRDDQGNLAYGGDFGEDVHDGNFVCDGLITADSTPTSGLIDWAATIAPIRVHRDGNHLLVSNRMHAASAKIAVEWRIDEQGVERASGHIECPAISAGDVRSVEIGAELGSALSREWDSDTWLTIELTSRIGTEWSKAGSVLFTAQEKLAGLRSLPRLSIPTHTPTVEGSTIALGAARFEHVSGDLISLGELPITGPVPELWRAPTDNDEGHGPLDYEILHPHDVLFRAQRGPSSADRWRAVGLDRLRRRTVGVELADHELTVRYRTAPAASPVYIDSEIHYTYCGDELHCTASITPGGPWTSSWPRLALRFQLPGNIDEAQWFGLGPGESYPDMREGTRVGIFSSRPHDLLPRQARPQESGHRSELRYLALSSDGRTRLKVTIDSCEELPGFTLSPWTSQELSNTSHHHLLRESGDLYLYLDLAQQGLGSRSCGPGVRPEQVLSPRPMTVSFTLSTHD